MFIFVPRYGRIKYTDNNQKEILEQILKVKLGYHIPSLKKLFTLLSNKCSTIKRKIKKANKTKTEKVLISYYEKYEIELIQPQGNINKKKEPKEIVKKRVKRFRSKSKKVSLQINISKDLKNKFDTIKRNENLTSEELIIKLLDT